MGEKGDVEILAQNHLDVCAAGDQATPGIEDLHNFGAERDTDVLFHQEWQP